MKLDYLIISLCIMSLASACSGDSQDSPTSSSDNATESSQARSSNVAQDTHTKLANSEPWNGEALGYVHAATSPADRIELFIRFGRLLSAATNYRRSADEVRRLREPDAATIRTEQERMAAIINQDLLLMYAAIDPVVQAKAKTTKTTLDIQSALVALTDPQQIRDVINGDRKDRDTQYAANQKVHLLSSRVGEAVLAFFPSRHEFLLASSTLIREAGDIMAVAVSADGVIVNTDLLWQAYTLMNQSMKLDPKNVTYCDAQRLPMRAHKDAVGALLDQMVPIQLGQRLKVTATDAYLLADQAQKTGMQFPETDSGKCA